MASRLRRVTVDLTPMLPGGANGGAKLVALALVRELPRLAPQTEFVLLTSEPSHAELAEYESSNVRRQPVEVDHVPTIDAEPGLARARATARVLVDTLLPSGARSRIKDEVWTVIKRRRRQQVTMAVKASTDLHFCPYTAPFYFDPAVPLVSVVHDLQFLDYPDFFAEQTRRERRQHFTDACERADRIICVSDFVRQSVLTHGTKAAGAVRTIHSAVLHATQLDPHAGVKAREVLKRIGIESRRYLLYPANPWPHKNHRKLIEAFSSFLKRNPESDLALICTGSQNEAAAEVAGIGRSLIPDSRFAFAGYLNEDEFGALLQSCRALIFPSLYEGFGLPILEAMAVGRPVLCSNTTSLPEIADDAALMFDPADPEQIVDAIARIESEPELEATLINRGKSRVREFGSARDMAARYLAAFEEVVAARQRT